MGPLLLANVPANTFQRVMLFCGFIPTTHAGLQSTIEEASPYNNISALIFMGQRDWIIDNDLTTEQAALFTDPAILTDGDVGHELPTSSDSTFQLVVDFLNGSVIESFTSTSTSKSTFDMIRTIFCGFIACVLGIIYITAVYFKQTMFATPSLTLAEPGSNAEEVIL